MRKVGKGFTLIELLLVMLILIMLLGSVTIAVQTFTQSWHKSLGRQRELLGELKNIDLLATTLKSIIPADAKAKDGSRGFYFLGDSNGFTAMTESGLFHTGAMAVFRLLKERQSDGKYSLVYEEAPLSGAPLVYADQTLSFEYRVKLLSDLTSLEFEYFGWPSYQLRLMKQTNDSADVVPSWFKAFDGMTNGEHPLKLRVSIDGYYWQISLIDRAAFLIGRRPQSES